MTKVDMGLSGASVYSVDFHDGGVEVYLHEDGVLTITGDLALTDSDGEISWLAKEMGTSAATLRLLGGMLDATITSSQAETTDSSFDLEFDSGLKLHYDAIAEAQYGLWRSLSPHGVELTCKAPGPLSGRGLRDHQAEQNSLRDREPATPDADEGESLIDLELSQHVYGVTVFPNALELLTWDGTIYFVGPFLLSSQDGDGIRFDPAEKGGDAATGAVLDRLIDSTIVLAALAPETSALSVQFDDGSVLQWEAPTPEMSKFRARHRSGWEFHSRGDGTVYWYGGPAGGHPKFLAGGPRGAD